jgi:hypothetical protein
MDQNVDVFREEDFDTAFELEAGGEGEGWNRVGSWTADRQFWKKMNYDVPIPLHLKCTIRLDGVPLEHCRELLTNVQLRNSWDRGYFELEQLGQFSDFSKIYWIVHLPFLVQDRDMVQLMTQKWIPEKEAHVILYRGDPCASASKPETSEYIRMKTGLSYTILRRAADDQNSTIMSALGNNEYGGWLPYFIMGPVYARTLTKLSERLIQAYEDFSNESQESVAENHSLMSVQECDRWSRAIKDQR